MRPSEIWRRFSHLFSFARITAPPNDAASLQTAQVKFADGYGGTRDDVPVLHIFGLSSTAPVGTSVLVVGAQGDRGNAIILGSLNQGDRPVNTPIGGVKLYDQGGRFVGMLNDGNIIMMAPGETLRQLMTDVALAVYNEHTHPVSDAPGTTGVPNQQMSTPHLTGATRAGGP